MVFLHLIFSGTFDGGDSENGVAETEIGANPGADISSSDANSESANSLGSLPGAGNIPGGINLGGSIGVQGNVACLSTMR